MHSIERRHGDTARDLGASPLDGTQLQSGGGRRTVRVEASALAGERPVRVELQGDRGPRVRLRLEGRRSWTRRLAAWWRATWETLGVVALFVGLGLGWAGVESALMGGRAADVQTPGPYAPSTMPEIDRDEPSPSDPPRVWLVDGYNVLHAGVLRGRDRREWWSAATQARLLAVVETFDDPDAEIWVVFDDARSGFGERCAVPGEGCRVRVAFAPSADDWLVKCVRGAERPDQFAVVTADRQVQGRTRHRGARVVSPLVFLARCDRSEKAVDA